MTRLEFDLIDALNEEAARVPDEVIDRLRRVDYRPRTRRLSRARILGGAGLSAATTAGIVTALVLGGATPAYAGWTAQPSAATTAPSSSVDQRCLSRLASLPGSQPGWAPVVTDTRGPYTLVVEQAGSAQATCLTGPALTAVSVTGAGGRVTMVTTAGSPAPGTPFTMGGSGSLRVFTPSPSAPIDRVEQRTLSSSEGAYAVVDGHVAADVTAVTLTLADGSTVGATVANGWFLAWWPSAQSAVSATITTPGGTTTQQLT